MDKRELKSFLAGLGIATLLAGTTLMAGGCAKKMGKSGCGGGGSCSGMKKDSQQMPADDGSGSTMPEAPNN